MRLQLVPYTYSKRYGRTDSNRYIHSLGAADCRCKPAADVYETERGYEIDMEVAGVGKDELSVDFKEGVLTVSGERKRSGGDNDNGRKLVGSERTFGSISRSWKLPRYADPDNIRAAYDNGLLKLVIGKRPEIQPRKITVN